jgi:ankyrin repeat protein
MDDDLELVFITDNSYLSEEDFENKKNRLLKLIELGPIEKLKDEIKKFNKVNYLNKDGDTILHNLLKEHEFDIIIKLAKHKFPTQVCNSAGDTILHTALKLNYMGVILDFIKNGVSGHLKNSAGDTILHTIIKDYSYYHAKNFLIWVRKFNFNITNKMNETVSGVAIKLGRTDVIKQILKKIEAVEEGRDVLGCHIGGGKRKVDDIRQQKISHAERVISERDEVIQNDILC